MENQKKEREITLGYLFGVFKKCFIFMIIAAVLFGALGVVYSTVIEKPKYQATSTFWVTNNSPEDYTTSGLTTAAATIATSCIELATQDMPIRRAVTTHGLTEKLGYANDDDCVNAIRKMITATKEDETSIVFYVTVKSGSREVTCEVINALQSVMPDVLQELCSFDKENPISLVKAVSNTATLESVSEVKSSPVTMAIICAFIAAVLVYVVFFVMSIFDTSVYDESTLKENFDYPIVGHIPSFATPEEEAENKKFKKRRSGHDIAPRNYEKKLLAADSPFFMTESFNTLRTNVIYSATAAKNPIFAVTSDVAAAGKTIVAANLAIALSNLDKKVLLVECDMRCPSFTKLFGERHENGLSELLAGMVEKTEDVVHNYRGTGLDVLFCGKIPPNPSELLSCFRMSELAEEWKSKYDYIVLDLPPIGEVYDAGVVSSIVNGYVITVRANRSNISDVRTSIERVESVNGTILGIILNDINLKSSKKYKQYYSYGETSYMHGTKSDDR